MFTDYNVAGFFKRDSIGNLVSLRNAYQTPEQAMPKMKDDEFTPSEYLKLKKYDEAKTAFAVMNMNEYQITYLAYDLMNKKPLDIDAVKTVLDVAIEQHPKSSVVYSRLGDYYVKRNDKPNAIKSYQKAVELDPTDQQTKDALSSLIK